MIKIDATYLKHLYLNKFLRNFSPKRNGTKKDVGVLANTFRKEREINDLT